VTTQTFVCGRGASVIVHVYPLVLQGYRDGAMQGAWTGVFRGTGVRLCTILDMNFREFLKAEVHAGVEVCIAPPRSAKTAGEVCPCNLPSANGVRGHKRPPGAQRRSGRRGLGHRDGAKRRAAPPWKRIPPQLEASSDEGESPQTVEDLPERAEHRPAVPQRLRRAHRDICGAGCSESEGRRSDCRDLWCPLTGSSQASAWSSMMKTTSIFAGPVSTGATF
jgi:hypothetical protein